MSLAQIWGILRTHESQQKKTLGDPDVRERNKIVRKPDSNHNFMFCKLCDLSLSSIDSPIPGIKDTNE